MHLKSVPECLSLGRSRTQLNERFFWIRMLTFGYKLLLRSRAVFAHEYACGYIEMCILSA